MNWATVFGVTRSRPCADSVAVSRVTRSGKGATILVRSACGTPRRQPLAAAADQDDVVGLRELVQDRLEGQDAAARLRVEALDPGRPVFHEAREALLGQPVLLRPAEQLLVVDVGVPEAGRHGHADLGTAATHFVGDRQNRHGISPARQPLGSRGPGRPGRTVAGA